MLPRLLIDAEEIGPWYAASYDMYSCATLSSSLFRTSPYDYYSVSDSSPVSARTNDWTQYENAVQTFDFSDDEGKSCCYWLKRGVFLTKHIRYPQPRPSRRWGWRYGRHAYKWWKIPGALWRRSTRRYGKKRGPACQHQRSWWWRFQTSTPRIWCNLSVTCRIAYLLCHGLLFLSTLL